jgi:aminoglycoside N3'-acetyltransferase
MYTKESLIQQLEQLGLDGQGTLLIHSSMKSLGEVEGGADTVLNAFTDYMKEGLLVLPPTRGLPLMRITQCSTWKILPTVWVFCLNFFVKGRA